MSTEKPAPSYLEEIFHNCPYLEVTNVFFSRGMDKETVAYQDNEILFRSKKK
jgi:hypothetical protein